MEKSGMENFKFGTRFQVYSQLGRITQHKIRVGIKRNEDSQSLMW